MPLRSPLRIYCDTSVFGGCFDEEFAVASNRLFDLVRDGKYRLVISQTTLDELNRAPEHVRQVLNTLPPESVEFINQDQEIDALCEAYLRVGVVGPSSRNDASHISAASVARVDMIVSWNFRHIVHYDKIQGYHGVNLLMGYFAIPIYSPPEVI